GDTRLQVDLDIVVARRRNDADDLVHPGVPGAARLAVEMIAVAERVNLAGAIVVDEQIRLELIQAALDQRGRHRHACEAYAGQGTEGQRKRLGGVERGRETWGPGGGGSPAALRKSA